MLQRAGFRTDGIFIEDPSSLRTSRNMEFIGDSITAATNLVRPPGAPSCADHNTFQSDWTRSYTALLCHHFGASCSTIAIGGKCMMRECGGLQVWSKQMIGMRLVGMTVWALCMCVCVCVCMHARTHACTYVCTYVCTHVCMYARMYVRLSLAWWNIVFLYIMLYHMHIHMPSSHIYTSNFAFKLIIIARLTI